MAFDRKVAEDNDDRRLDDKRGGQTTLKEGVPILSAERENLEGSKKAKRRTAPSNNEYRGPTEADIGVPREPLVRTPGYMGHVEEVKRKILVARHVQERARLRDYV